jgi:hypothetical protein
LLSQPAWNDVVGWVFGVGIEKIEIQIKEVSQKL